MSEIISIDLSNGGHLVDPPIVDFLAYEAALNAFVAEFVPESKFSHELKESVYILNGTDGARRIQEYLEMLCRICGSSTKITRIAYGGEGNFSFYTEDNQVIELHDSSSPQQSMDVYAVLQILSQEIQLEFISQRRAKQRQAI